MTKRIGTNEGEGGLRVGSILADVRRPWISSDLGEGVQPPQTPQTPQPLQPLQPLPVEIMAGISNNVCSSSSTKLGRMPTSLKPKK